MIKKMKKQIAPFFLIGLIIVFSECSEQEDFADKGREAATEFCECYKKNTKENCLDNLKDKYEKRQYMSEEFIDSFNETNSCDVEMHVEYSDASHRIEINGMIY